MGQANSNAWKEVNEKVEDPLPIWEEGMRFPKAAEYYENGDFIASFEGELMSLPEANQQKFCQTETLDGPGHYTEYFHYKKQIVCVEGLPFKVPCWSRSDPVSNIEVDFDVNNNGKIEVSFYAACDIKEDEELVYWIDIYKAARYDTAKTTAIMIMVSFLNFL